MLNDFNFNQIAQMAVLRVHRTRIALNANLDIVQRDLDLQRRASVSVINLFSEVARFCVLYSIQLL